MAFGKPKKGKPVKNISIPNMTKPAHHSPTQFESPGLIFKSFMLKLKPST